MDHQIYYDADTEAQKNLVWVGIGGLVALSIIGIPLSMLIWGVAWLWKAYRLIRGFIDLSDNQAMPT